MGDCKKTVTIIGLSEQGQWEYLLPNTIRVSAIVSAFKSATFMNGCLQDLTAQTMFQKGNMEIIVVDSASPEDERSIVASFQGRYKNIIYIRTDQRESLYGAWNRAIPAAKGLFLTNANTDDRHHPKALEELAAILDQHPDVDLVYGQCKESRVANQTYGECPSDFIYDYPEYDPPRALLHYQFGAQPLWRASLHNILGGFNADYFAVGDYEFNLRFAMAGRKAKRLNQVLGVFYLNPNSLTGNPRQQAEKGRLLKQYRTRENVLRLYQLAGASIGTETEKAALLQQMGRLAFSFTLPWSKKPGSASEFAAECFRWALRCTPHNREILADLKQLNRENADPVRSQGPDLAPQLIPPYSGLPKKSARRIAFFAGDEDNFSFAKPVIEYLGKVGHQVQVHPCRQLSMDQLAEILKLSDLAWFDFGNGPIIAATHLPKICPMICRIHRYEIYGQEIKQVQWQKVDRMLFVNPVFAGVFKELVDPQIETKTRIEIIPNPVAEKFRFRPRSNNFNLAYVSRFQGDKNPALMIQILQALVSRDTRYKLFMIGRIQDVQLYQYSMKLVKDLGLQDHFIYQGQIEDVENWLEDKSFLLSTSIVESQGLGIMEAMMKGDRKSVV
jgi:glycosyltransferase involved in cell wall biosynthesis/GT2 family glycosyltransferase